MNLKKKRTGFTILEVMLSIVILLVGVLALSSLQTTSVGTNYTSHRMTVATLLAQDKLEELKTLAWNNAQLSDTQNNFTVDADSDGAADNFDWTQTPDHDNADGPAGIANPIDENGNPLPGTLSTQGYYRFWNVADSVPAAKMKTISVRVQWQEKRAHSVTLDTVISQN